MKIKRDVLLGTTEDNTIIFADVEFRSYNGCKYTFSVSFSEVAPVAVTDDLLRDIVADQLACDDYQFIVGLLEQYDCKPSELADKHYEHLMKDNGVDRIIDISLFPERLFVGGEHIYFESLGCGQMDVRGRLIPINSFISHLILDYWEEFHLKSLEWGHAREILEWIDAYLDDLGDELEWIKNWLIKQEERECDA